MDFQKITDKWQKAWEENKTFQVTEDKSKKKFYVLEMYPYPSGSGLHMGHAFNYTIGDIYARYKILNNYNTLHPMGFDSFGLPAENAAIKHKSHPKEFTEKAIVNFIKQQKALGLTYDWSRKIQSHSPEYYKWDQWIFLKMFEKGLAYKKKSLVNWCPKCNTVLANEQVQDGKCWRHKDTEVNLKPLEQWFLKITDYADELYTSLDKLEQWPEDIKAMQKNWIGKSHGTEIIFKINNEDWKIFTTRPDTLYGATFVVISAQHSKLKELVTKEQSAEVNAFLKKIKSTSEKNAKNLEKEGAFTGSYAIHPLTKEKIPVYTGNFVLADYGSGMVMAVPAHDQRDFEFAQTQNAKMHLRPQKSKGFFREYSIKIKLVIQPKNKPIKVETMKRAYTTEGTLINSKDFNNLSNKKAIEEITKYLEKNKLGKKTTNFKLRDWSISRQRFWGTPIPIIYCEKCGAQPVPEKDLPVVLPEDIKFISTENPLKTYKLFLETTCPKCKGKATRETDTMDTFVNSSWYFLRYTDPTNSNQIFKSEKANYWAPVDFYIGGKEHACMHLIYSRFYTKFLRDLKLIKADEPTNKLFNQGMLHGDDGYVMSKSRGNVIDPLTTIKKYSADTLRFFLVSVASPDKDFSWSSTGIESTHRFIQKITSYFESVKIKESTPKSLSKLNKSIQEITDYIESLKYNLATIKLRQLFDALQPEESKETLESFLRLLNPFCPHITEEIWEKLGNKPFISTSTWPESNQKLINDKYELEDEIQDQLTSDIEKIKQLAKLKILKKVTLITSAKWKYDFIKKLKLEMDKGNRNISQLIQKCLIKYHEKESSKLLQQLLKHQARIPKTNISQKEDLELLNNLKQNLEKQFNTKIEIIQAENLLNATEQVQKTREKQSFSACQKDKVFFSNRTRSEDRLTKANNALPTKPAIIVE